MEVHHHTHHPKKWKEYITEFIMLFAAVTLGFFAENVRENLSNREKEKEIVLSLKEELSKDTSELNFLINEYPNKINTWNDSLHYLVENKTIKGNEGLFIQAINNSTVWHYYSAGEVALSLTQSTESMNLIENNKLKKQLLEYRKNENFYAEYLKFIVTTFQQTDTAMLSIFNLKTLRQSFGKSSLDQLFISSENIPKYIFFNTYDKNILNLQLRNIDHSDLKITDLKTIYSMMLLNEKEILNTIKEEYN
jgi:hypothetical protein